MPAPLLLYGLVASICVYIGRATNMTYSQLETEIRAKILTGIVEMAATRAGLELDPNDPISDASISHALSLKSGVNIRSVRDRDMIEEDLLTHAAYLIKERTGLELTDMRDRDAIRTDVIKFTGSKLGEVMGIQITDITNRTQTLEEVKEWAKLQTLASIKVDANKAYALLVSSGYDVDQQVAHWQAQGKEITARQYALGMLSQIMNEKFIKAAKLVKDFYKNRRRIENREAQRRFRMRHGNRQVYIPVDTPL